MIGFEEFARRRADVLAQMAPDSICAVAAGHLQTRSNDTEFLFRQNSYFEYLCGFPEPDAVLLLSNRDGASVLFCLPRDKHAEIWHGRRVGPERAAEQFGLDEAYALEELEEGLLSLLEGHQHVYLCQGQDEQLDTMIFDTVAALRNAPKQSKVAPHSFVDLHGILDEMRLFKSDAELAIMARAGNISAQAHIRAMQYCRPGAFEYQLEAELHHAFAMQGARSPAYGTIVGSGDNACILHYTENADELKAGDLVLIDAGAELHGYAADITRTFPVSGRFTPPQATLYELVLEAQKASMTFIKPGSTLKRATDESIRVITQGLIGLGILQGEMQDNIDRQTYRQFYMHGLSHWLGMDVHDVGAYKINGQDRPLEPGMVMTIEPGIYIAPDADVEPQWQGIGIRIEDNLVVTEEGHLNLTESAPKSIAAIESLMQQGR